MRKPIKALAVSSAVVAALAVASTLYAHDPRQSGSSMMRPGMMEQGGMMGMTGKMTDGCRGMMQSMNRDGRGKPNEQWRAGAPDSGKTPGTKG